MKSVTLSIVLKSSSNKDGSYSVFLCAYHNAKRRFFTLTTVLKKDWNTKKNRVATTDADYLSKNQIIEAAMVHAQTIVHNHLLSRKLLSLDDFAALYQSDYNNESFIEFGKQYVASHDFSSETKHTYSTEITKITCFKASIKFSDITTDFVTRYINYMRTQRKNNDNTIWKSLTFVRTLWHEAMRQGKVNNDVFDGIKIKKVQGNRTFLDETELKKLVELYRTNKLHPGQQNTLRNFLFSCTTGIRFGDMKQLVFADLQNDVVSFKQHKTKEFVRIPVSKPAIEFLGDTTGFLPNQKLFRVLTNQKTNEHLKQILPLVGINKNITYHCARHTFATLSLQKGMPIDTISKILGHTNVKTTNIYLKYNDELKKRYLELWNDL